jgi:hypothetical protein
MTETTNSKELGWFERNILQNPNLSQIGAALLRNQNDTPRQTSPQEIRQREEPFNWKPFVIVGGIVLAAVVAIVALRKSA